MDSLLQSNSVDSTLANSVIIASTPRCGSHLLGRAMNQTSLLGDPQEYFHPANFKEWKHKYKTNNISDTVDRLVSCRSTCNGVFSIKIHYDHLEQCSGFQGMMNLFPNALFILMLRRDLIAQAVSRSIARQSGQWIKLNRTSSPLANRTHAISSTSLPTPRYDYELIEFCLNDTVRQNNQWKKFASLYGVHMHEFFFEDVVEDVDIALSEIAGIANVNFTPLGKSVLQTQSQSSKLNLEWIDRYSSETKHKSKPYWFNSYFLKNQFKKFPARLNWPGKNQ